MMLQNAEASAAQISALEREIELLKERSDLLGQKGARQDELIELDQSRAFADELNKDLKRAFSDAFKATDDPLKAFGDSLHKTNTARVFAALSEQLASGFLDMLGLGAKGGAGGGGFGNFLGALLGAPDHANGGGVMAGGLYEINESGPEVLAMGGKQYLMMGNQGGPSSRSRRHERGQQLIDPGASRPTDGNADRCCGCTGASARGEKSVRPGEPPTPSPVSSGAQHGGLPR